MSRRYFSRQNKSVSMDAMVYRGPNDELEIEVEVTGHLVPYSAGNYDNPPEGGYVEDVVATFMDGKKGWEIPLTDDEVDTFSEQMMESADGDD
jgi:hypothetical protein